MTTPDRSISGLPPRKPRTDASRLIAANRPTTSTPATGEAARPPDATAARVKVSVYLDAQLRDAARAAYRATAHLENDASWSDMIEKAVTAEVERRQHAHNDGKPFSASRDKLTPGRTITG